MRRSYRVKWKMMKLRAQYIGNRSISDGRMGINLIYTESCAFSELNFVRNMLCEIFCVASAFSLNFQITTHLNGIRAE